MISAYFYKLKSRVTSKKKPKKRLIHIPNEILLHIFEFLTPQDLFHAMLVNSYFNNIANEEYLW